MGGQRQNAGQLCTPRKIAVGPGSRGNVTPQTRNRQSFHSYAEHIPFAQ